jgi:SAM-dependent methyltransferase
VRRGFAEALFHRLCFREAVPPQYTEEEYEAWFDESMASASSFFRRHGDHLRLQGASLLDVGCGAGAVCVEAAQRGARRAVGVDVQPLGEYREIIARRVPEAAPRIELLETDGTLDELGAEVFDLVVSKDSFEHYPDPESFVHVLAGRVAPGGTLAIYFAPLWKSPKGGHIDFMTKVPWVHLVFPESVIMKERRRFRPSEDPARFEDIRGGLNKMTLRRFRAIMATSALACRHFETNPSERPIVRAMTLVAKIRPLREYFTTGVFGVWQKPPELAAAR